MIVFESLENSSLGNLNELMATIFKLNTDFS